MSMMENSSVLPPNTLDATCPIESSQFAIPKTLWIISLIIFCLVFVVGITGNGLVIWVAGFRMTRTVTTVLFLNLALADFTFTVFLPLYIIGTIWKKLWGVSKIFCLIVIILANLNMSASVFLLTLISLDRCVSVLWPLWARKHRTPHRAALGAAGAWIFALAFTVPTVSFRTTEVGVNDNDYCYYEFTPWIETRDNTVYNDALYKSYQWPLALSRFLLGFLIPLLIISVCCGLITVKLLRRLNKIKSSRPFRILTAVVAAFFLCWFPCHLERLIEASLCSRPHLSKVLPYLSFLSIPMIFVNSCLNPLLYVFVGQDFRERLFRSLPVALEQALSEEAALTGTTGSSSSLVPPTNNAKIQDL